jgi:serine phosphatase RsbU (regulator of sigma subunit)
MVLYTDGITEARSKKDGSMFEEESLVKTIEKSGNKSASQIHLDTLESLKDYDKPDDATLFVMRRV